MAHTESLVPIITLTVELGPIFGGLPPRSCALGWNLRGDTMKRQGPRERLANLKRLAR